MYAGRHAPGLDPFDALIGTGTGPSLGHGIWARSLARANARMLTHAEPRRRSTRNSVRASRPQSTSAVAVRKSVRSDGGAGTARARCDELNFAPKLRGVERSAVLTSILLTLS